MTEMRTRVVRDAEPASLPVDDLEADYAGYSTNNGGGAAQGRWWL